MSFSRRQFLAAAGITATAFPISACVGPHTAPEGHASSYASQILKPENRNTVFHWMDIALQQTRDQRVLTPRAAYNYGLASAAGFLAANGIVQAYDEPLQTEVP